MVCAQPPVLPFLASVTRLIATSLSPDAYRVVGHAASVNRGPGRVGDTNTNRRVKSSTDLGGLAGFVRRLVTLMAVGVLAQVSAVASVALAQSDSQPPRVSSQSPAAGATGVSITINVTATFNEPVQPASIAFVLRDASNAIVPSSLSYNAATRTVTLDPQVDLQPGKTYTATLSAAADLAGNTLSPPVVWSFTTHPGFQEAIVFAGLVEPTSIQFAPDGRVFVAEKSGLIKVFASLLSTTPTVFADLRDQGVRLRRKRTPWAWPSIPVSPRCRTSMSSTRTTHPSGGPRRSGATAALRRMPTQCVVSGRLSRLQASGNVMIGAEQVLVEDWFQRYPGQPVGGLAFGPDGALYASAGDGASSAFVDLGQGFSPSPDPPSEGGALRSQDLRTPADPVALSGTVIRVHPDTGAPVRQTTSMLVGTPTVDANGVKSYPVTSVFQGPQPTIVRVLEPTSPAPGKLHRHLYVLPVETGVTEPVIDLQRRPRGAAAPRRPQPLQPHADRALLPHRAVVRRPRHRRVALAGELHRQGSGAVRGQLRGGRARSRSGGCSDSASPATAR